jgi:hypothetical protein
MGVTMRYRLKTGADQLPKRSYQIYFRKWKMFQYKINIIFSNLNR